MPPRRAGHKHAFLGDKELDKLYHHFLHLDSSGTGAISFDALMAHPLVADSPLALRIAQVMDRDASGDISFAEFVEALAVFSSRAKSSDKMRFAFDVYDLDADGYISNGELFLVLRMMSGDSMQAEQLQQVVDKTIRDADRDGDGRLSFDEFMGASVQRNSDIVRRWCIPDL